MQATPLPPRKPNFFGFTLDWNIAPFFIFDPEWLKSLECNDVPNYHFEEEPQFRRAA